VVVSARTDENGLKKLPENDMLSPVLLSTAARSIYDLLASPERAKPKLPRVVKALKTSRWQRHGIYLSLKDKLTMEEWAMLFREFLEAGFLLPPFPAHPLILPGELSVGEEAKLAMLIEKTLYEKRG
jgi:hypothetical protein